jgi:hypothetical protein
MRNLPLPSRRDCSTVALSTNLVSKEPSFDLISGIGPGLDQAPRPAQCFAVDAKSIVAACVHSEFGELRNFTPI